MQSAGSEEEKRHGLELAHGGQRTRGTLEYVVVDDRVDVCIVDTVLASSKQLQSLVDADLGLLGLLVHLLCDVQARVLPDVCLHTDTVVSVLLQETQPDLNNLGMAVLDLNQSPQRDTLKVFLTLLVDEVGSRNGPALGDFGKRNRTFGGQVEVVSGTQGKVGKEFEVADTVGAQL